MAKDEVVDDGDNRVFGPRRSRGWFRLSHVVTSQNKGIGALVTEGGPENTHGSPDGGDTGDAHGQGLFETVVISAQDGLMKNQTGEQIVERAAEIDIAGFGDRFAFTLALSSTGIIATANQARTAKEQSGS
jgi:hypothetical protein